MGSAAAESAFKRELLFSQDALRQKPTLKVDQLFSIRLLYTPFSLLASILSSHSCFAAASD